MAKADENVNKQAPDRRALGAQLHAGLVALALPLDDTVQARLLDYLELLAKWNAVYNLTAIRDPQAMLVHHLLDSLAIVAPLAARLGPKPCVVDVGSGGGLPGIVLAIVWPEASLHLVEPVGKKAAFLRQCALELGLANLRVHASHVERLSPASLDPRPPAHESTAAPPASRGGVFDSGSAAPNAGPACPDLILCRAFASLADFVAGIDALVGPTTIVAAMKGVYPEAELAELVGGWQLADSERLQVPFLDAERHLLVLRRAPVPVPASA